MPLTKLSVKHTPSPKATATRILEFEAIGTLWRIALSDISLASLAMLKRLIRQRIEQFDRHYSRFRADSLVSAMAQHKGRYTLPDDARPLFDLYEQLYEHTNGAMTPLIGQALSDAGYDAQYSLQVKQLHATPAWDVVLEYAFPMLIMKQPALLDLGAAGKGYLVDIVAELIQEAGITEFCVNAGGDIVQRGMQAEAIGLEHPRTPTQVIGIAQLYNRSLCGSSGNRRAWDTYHHIIDPHTRHSPRQLRAIWVVADSALLADGLTTALFFTDATVLSRWYNFEYAIVWKDYSFTHSANFPAEFFDSATDG